MKARIAVESWDPELGGSFLEGELQPSDARVDPGVEVEPSRWRPLAPAVPLPLTERVVFVDGVRRIDAVVWVTEPGGELRLGLCASYGAGAVVAAERAEVTEARVERGVFTAAALAPLETRVGTYHPAAASGDSAPELSAAIQRALRRLETEVARGLAEDGALVVVDGPLSAEHRLPAAIGYVKTHRVRYLPGELEAVVAALAPGERTPLFLTETSWARYSAYLRLPGPRAHPWSGVVRLELPGTVPLEEALPLVERARAALPRFASTPEKDPRAPQNLFPIGGLERALRRRLGDAALVHRALRVAAAPS